MSCGFWGYSVNGRVFARKIVFEEDNPPFPPLPFFVEPEVLKSSRSGSP